jgi:outer membrane receptor for ferrienterochelin and colicin
MLRNILTILILLGTMASFAQTQGTEPASDTTDLSNLSLEQLARLKSRYSATEIEKTISQAIEAASRNPLALRKSPSIISVITDEEIIRSGARTLMDVLKMVPGIEFNVDVTGVVAISFRGLWANEGNLLLMIDGQECNETAYNSIQLGNHYPVNQIKRIEIIRGPGSAIYGGAAEYAVINIISYKGNDLKGLEANVTGGQVGNGYSKQNINVAFGDSRKDLNYSVAGALGRAQSGNLNYQDVYGTSYNMNGNSATGTQYLNAGISYKDLSFRFIYDNYEIAMRDGYIAALSKPYPCNFRNMMSELKYQKTVNRKISLAGKINFKQCSPWENTQTMDPADTNNYSYYKITADRLKMSLSANWNITRWLNGNIGAEGIYDEGRKYNGNLFKYDSTDHVSYLNYAPFGQLFITTPITNITIGGRYDISNVFGSTFNPRLGITKRIGKANFKFLYASSFRAPSIENIQYSIYGTKLKPERSNTLEFEAGFKLNKNMYLSVNAFDITTYNAIKYYVKTDSASNGDLDGYRNSDKITGSDGFEIEYKYKDAFGYLSASYSYYTVANKSVDSSNMVPLDRSMTLGIAQHKFSLYASFNIGRHFYISPSVQFLGKRYGIASVDSDGNGILQQYSPQTIVNIFAGTTIVKNFTIGAGVNNITNQDVLYIQAYNSLHAPLPGFGTEFYLSIKYKLHFNKETPGTYE